jgi:voltage-gated potassium channel
MASADKVRAPVGGGPRTDRPAAGLARRYRVLKWQFRRRRRPPAIGPLTLDPVSVWGQTTVRRVLQGVLAEGVVVAWGVCGYLLMGWGLGDAAYMVAITISGVGYGEVRPVATPLARLHTVTVIILGMVVVGYTLARFIQCLTEAEIQNLVGHRRMRRQIEALSGHTIVAGYGRVGSLVCDELAEGQLPFVVIELQPESIPEIEARGHLYVLGDATEEKVLRDAGLERANVLVTVMPNDAVNVFITLTAREIAPSVMIVARAEQAGTPKKLRQAGADHVIQPAQIGAHRIVSLLTNPTAVEFAELVTKRSSLAIEMDDVPIGAGSPLKGQTLRDADIGRRTGVIVIAVKRADGRVEFPPSGDEALAPGDSIVVLGRRSNLDRFRKLFES